MNALEEQKIPPKQLNPLTLAFIGDAVFELMIRENLLQEAEYTIGIFNQKKVASVNASAQAKAARRLLPHLTETEEMMFKRGRNAQTSKTPKHATQSEYQYATGLEALFGYLYLNGEEERMYYLFHLIQE